MSATNAVPVWAPANIVLFSNEGDAASFLALCPFARLFSGLNAVSIALTERSTSILTKFETQIFQNEACFLPYFQIEEPQAAFALASEDFPDINSAPLSWALGSVGIGDKYAHSGEGVRIAVLDSGVDANHPDLAHSLRDTENLRSFVPSESVEDFIGHGTHCAGIIAGRRDSVSGLSYGVAPAASLLIGKVFDRTGRGSDELILDGIEWAQSAGAKVISMSFEKSRKPNVEPSPLYQSLAERLIARGILLVAAAGNRKSELDTDPVSDPAACQGIIGVASIDQYGNVAKSCRAASDPLGKLDLAAPGVGIYSSWPNGNFKTVSGTSMAAPHVAGITALYQEAYPKCSGLELMTLILDRAKKSANIPATFGRGIVQAP